MKINFLGDSITNGSCATCRENTYATIVCKHFCAEELNFGIGGTRIADQKDKKEPHDFLRFYDRAVKMDKSADFTFVFGGTNDYGHGDAPLGDKNCFGKDTFYGAMRELADYISKNFDVNKVCFILPIPRYDQDNLYGDGTKNQPIAPLSKYIDIEKEVLNEYKLEYLDLSDKFYVPKTNLSEGIYQDGLHPNDEGHRLLATLLIEYLEKKLG
ncbi:MAG: SGNH/GDSL hydrolase family protein [Clostridia bacterium]|nr:SGNH/GDSL hydrolase family protein [Clostridia bacterium]